MTVRFYLVGGYVRDELLRAQGNIIAQGDRDWVVVGATPQWMIEHGFRPVGADFPVFLHPKTHEEYALARTERKTHLGYHGFRFYSEPDVTLEQDLKRRDLTINAMAKDAQGHIIDPYGGQTDLSSKILRHVSEAFIEDPVRILRLARFAAKFPDFSVAPQTNELASEMVRNGETDALVPERIWKELSKGFTESSPRKMLEVLQHCGYWARSFASVPLTSDVLKSIDRARHICAHPDVICAVLFFTNQTPESVRQLLSSLRAPGDTIGLCEMLTRLAPRALHAHDAQDIAQLLLSADVLRRPNRFALFTYALSALFPQLNTEKLSLSAKAFCSVNAGVIAQQQQNPKDIATAVALARQHAIQDVIL